MAVLLSPLFNNDGSQIDSNGDPRSGALLFTYLSTTSTKATTYKDSAGAVAHTNPIVLNSNGLPPAPIWLTTGSTYKFVLAPSTDTDPPASAILTIDNVSAVNDTAAAATSTEWTASGMSGVLYLSATSFRVDGDQTTVLHVGRRLKTTNTAGTVYATIIKSAFTSFTTVTVLNDGSGALDSGLSAFSYGIVSADNTSAPFISRDQQCGRLVYVSATSIRLDPQDGNTMWVYSGSDWRRRIIPSAGITAADTNTYVNGTSGQTLANNTQYFVYLFDNAGVLTLDFSTTVPAVDAVSGLKIKTGVATRLLVGQVRTNGSHQFADAAATRTVISWYKRRGIRANAAFTTTRTKTETSIVEINSEIQVKFLTWAEEAVACAYCSWVSNNSAGAGVDTYLCIDGITSSEAIGRVVSVNATANAQDNGTLAAVASLSEGFHTAYLCGAAITGGTASWFASGGGGNLYVLTQG
jgi:hypothetical protein